MLCVLAAFFLALSLSAETIPPAERAALVAFYESTGGPSWERRDGWLTDESPCDWEGVWCEPAPGPDATVTAHVSGLHLPDNRLRGQLPPELANLTHLRTLYVGYNDLTGPLPESLLEQWDRHELDLFAARNRFSNMVASVRIEVTSTGLRCAVDEDVRYFVELAEGGEARFESIRCGRGDTEYVLVREGRAPTLERLGRALKRLGFERLAAEYSYRFTFTTHQLLVLTTIRYGDGTVKTLQTYGEQGPIEAWLVERVVRGVVQEVTWEKESRRKRGG